MSLRSAAAVAALLLAGCADRAAPTQPDVPWYVGSYALRSVDGAPLPYAEGPGSTLAAVTITITADGGCEYVLDRRQGAGSAREYSLSGGVRATGGGQLELVGCPRTGAMRPVAGGLEVAAVGGAVLAFASVPAPAPWHTSAP